MSTMVSSLFWALFWALFWPYHLDVLKTYSALHHHHHHHFPPTEEDADKRSKETAASRRRRRWKDAARKLYNSRHHRQRGTTTTTDSSSSFFSTTFGHRLYYLLLLGYALRLLLLGWSLLSAGGAGWWWGAEGARALVRHDVFAQLGLAYTRLRRPSLMVAAAPLPLFAIAIHYVVFYRRPPDRRLWTQLYEVLVLTTEQYHCKYFAGSHQVWQGSLVSSVKNALKVLYTVNWRYFWNRRRLPTDDLLTLTNIYLFYQTIYYCGCAGAVSLHLYYIVDTFSLLPPVTKPLKLAAIFADLNVLLVIALYILKSGTFVSLTGGLIPQLAISEYRTLNVLLKQNNNKNYNHNKPKKAEKDGLPPADDTPVGGLPEATHRHHPLSLLHYNRKIVSDCCAAYLICNVPYNAMALLYLLFDKGGTKKTHLFVLATFFCLTVPLSAIFNFIAANEAIVSSVPHLRTSYLKVSQAKSMPGRFFTENWKTASYIELLDRSTGQLELRAGELGAFKRENVLQFVTVYAGFIMYFYVAP
ncbi:hypothetical protein TYRP_005227 [Tyrophagus putrescentiae]|nr:hypothetical protein TYRP_005227 [Tyrophagus putrescentiae]